MIWLAMLLGKQSTRTFVVDQNASYISLMGSKFIVSVYGAEFNAESLQRTL